MSWSSRLLPGDVRVGFARAGRPAPASRRRPHRCCGSLHPLVAGLGLSAIVLPAVGPWLQVLVPVALWSCCMAVRRLRQRRGRALVPQRSARGLAVPVTDCLLAADAAVLAFCSTWAQRLPLLMLALLAATVVLIGLRRAAHRPAARPNRDARTVDHHRGPRRRPGDASGVARR